MPKRTFIPSLLRYRRTHGFLRRVRDSPHILNRQRTMNMAKKKFPMLGPTTSFCRRRERDSWYPVFP